MTEEKFEQKRRTCSRCGRISTGVEFRSYDDMYWQCNTCGRASLLISYGSETPLPQLSFVFPVGDGPNDGGPGEFVSSFTENNEQSFRWKEMNEEDVLRLTNDRYADVKREVEHLCTALGLDLENPNFRETPRRVATWLLEKFPQSNTIQEQLDKLARSVFPSPYDEMVVQTGIRVNGLCPHHFKDVTYDVSIGYLPAGHTIGLSKLSRAAILILSQAGTQEDLTMQLAVALSKMLKVEDVAVVARAQHGCMTCRGIRMSDSRTTTSAMRGKFTHDENGTKSEFFSIIRSNK